MSLCLGGGRVAGVDGGRGGGRWALKALLAAAWFWELSVTFQNSNKPGLCINKVWPRKIWF